MRIAAWWRRPATWALAAILAGSLAGCGELTIQTRKIDYKSASNVKVAPLEIPPDLTSPARDDRFVVPDTGGRGTATYSAYAGERSQAALAQQPSEVLPGVDKAHVERDGNQRWLVVAEKPDKLWDRIKDFWQDLGFLIDVERPEAGVMETDWAENRAKIGGDFLRNWLGKVFDSLYSTPERDKFRTRLEPGAQPGTTEIYVSHRGMYEIFVSEGNDQTKWQPRDPDPELEAEILRRMMVYLGVEERRAQTQLAEAKNQPAERARIERAGKIAFLEVKEPFDRAWRRVGLALDRVGFTVEDRDRSKGLYYVRYVDPENDASNRDPGLLSKLAFWRPAPAEPQTRYQVEVKETESARTAVRVLTAKGALDETDTGNKILDLLFAQLK
ncbi:MAG: outer membrane protein assembly factor BamC [Candidatus Accumulibacter sp.]|jgi:outer membrane protein assembly factor BamC|nr:outer membrane protein assembly factor BamC [Accumulibacter sp.]